jgi:hypothetical protein
VCVCVCVCEWTTSGFDPPMGFPEYINDPWVSIKRPVIYLPNKQLSV